jgi:hypothetical protein
MPRVVEQFDQGAALDHNGDWVWHSTHETQHAQSELVFLGYIKDERTADKTLALYPLTDLGVSFITEWRANTPQPEKLIGLGGRVRR